MGLPLRRSVLVGIQATCYVDVGVCESVVATTREVAKLSPMGLSFYLCQ